MEKRKFFIYDRKEVGILILLGVGVSLFAFTLGVHLGKQVAPPPVVEAAEHEPTEKIEAETHQLPARSQIADQVKNVPGAVEDALDPSLRDEVVRNGLQVNAPKPLAYPDKTIAEKKAEKKLDKTAEHSAVTSTETHTEKSTPAHATSSAGKGNYAIQLGSYPKESDAKEQLPTFESLGLPLQIKSAQIEGKGIWYRILAGEYGSIKEADAAGKTLKHDQKIADYRVVRASLDGEKSSGNR